MWLARGSFSAFASFPRPSAPYAWGNGAGRAAVVRLLSGAHDAGSLSSRTRRARWIPDSASRGTAHDADTAQFPQSYNRTAATVRQTGCDGGGEPDGLIEATCRAPMPP